MPARSAPALHLAEARLPEFASGPSGSPGGVGVTSTCWYPSYGGQNLKNDHTKKANPPHIELT